MITCFTFSVTVDTQAALVGVIYRQLVASEEQLTFHIVHNDGDDI